MECPNCGRQISAYSRRCGSCGRIIPPGQHLLEESGLLESSAAAQTSSAVASPTCRSASLGDRLIAAMLDSTVLLGACSVVSVWSFMRWGYAGATDLQLTTASLLIAGALSGLIVFTYLWLLEAAFDATLGKAIVGIRLVRMTERSRLGASAIRNALRIVDGIGFYLVGAMFAECSRLRQRLGDMIAGTVVVEAPFSGTVKLLAMVLWVAALAGSAWGLPRVCGGQVSTGPPRVFGRSVVQLSYQGHSASIRVSRLRVGVDLAPAAPADLSETSKTGSSGAPGVAGVDSSLR